AGRSTAHAAQEEERDQDMKLPQWLATHDEPSSTLYSFQLCCRTVSSPRYSVSAVKSIPVGQFGFPFCRSHSGKLVREIQGVRLRFETACFLLYGCGCDATELHRLRGP